MTYTLLLTSTIYVNNCWFLQRNDPNDRIKDLKESLSKWFQNTTFNIVFVDNSNIDVSILREFIDKYEDRFEVLTYDGNRYPREFGKGFGERDSINYALEHSKFMKNNGYILKCTGRYFLSNLNNILNSIDHLEKYDAIVYKDNEDQSMNYSEFYYINKEIFKKYIYDIELNDSKGIWMEHALMHVLKNIDPKRILNVNYLGLEGISGSTNGILTWVK